MAAKQSVMDGSRIAGLLLGLAVLAWGLSACTVWGYPTRRENRRLAALVPDGQTFTLAWDGTDQKTYAFLEALVRRFNAENPRRLTARLLPLAGSLSFPLDLDPPYDGDLLLLPPSSVPASPVRDAAGAVDLLPYVRNVRWGLESSLGFFGAARFSREVLKDHRVKVPGDSRRRLYSFPVLRDQPLLYLNPDLAAALGPGTAPRTLSPGEFKTIVLDFFERQKRPGFLYPPDFILLVPRLAGVTEELTLLGAARAAEPLEAWVEFSSGALPLLFQNRSASGYLQQTILTAGGNFVPVPAEFKLRPPAFTPSGDLRFALRPSTEERQAAAWYFVRWFLSPEIQTLAAEALDLLPVLSIDAIK
jgi:ABC-type glycerol-3-phosphate transport system substrate-binding protein